jgi:hypothetical protein
MRVAKVLSALCTERERIVQDKGERIAARTPGLKHCDLAWIYTLCGQHPPVISAEN